MASYILKRKTFSFLNPLGVSDIMEAKKDMQHDAWKRGDYWGAIRQGFIQTKSDANKYLRNNPDSKYAGLLKRAYGKKVTAGVPSTNQSIAMGAPAGPSDIGAGVGAVAGGF